MFEIPTLLTVGAATVGLVGTATRILKESQRDDAPPGGRPSLAPPRDFFEMREHLLKAQAAIDSQTGLVARDIVDREFRVNIHGFYHEGDSAYLRFRILKGPPVEKVEILTGQGAVLRAIECSNLGSPYFRVKVDEEVFENWWRSTPNNLKAVKKNRILPLRLHARLPKGEVSRTFTAWATESYHPKVNGDPEVKYRSVWIESSFRFNMIDWRPSPAPPGAG